VLESEVLSGLPTGTRHGARFEHVSSQLRYRLSEFGLLEKDDDGIARQTTQTAKRIRQIEEDRSRAYPQSLHDCLAFLREDGDHGSMQTVFEAAGGMDGLRRLADAWHRRVMADEVVAHAFSHGFHPQHGERLAAYWAEALGGPATYSDSYGDETTVVKIHSGNGEHDEMDRRAIACFDEALADVGMANDPALRQVLHDYFAWATMTAMSRYHQSADDVPNGLSIPHWSWDGLQV
jgi:hemoglobin